MIINIKRYSIALLLFLMTTTGFTAELNFISPNELITPDTKAVLGVPLEVSGTVSSDDGISSVSVAVLDTTTSKWLGSNGWQEAWTDLKPNVTETSNTSANWSITLDLGSKGSGNYMLLPGFNDKKGVYHIKAAWERYFSARAPQTRVLSEIRYTTPTTNQSIQLPFKISGSVSSPTGIAQVG